MADDTVNIVLSEGAHAPTRGSSGAAGYDLYSNAEPCAIRPKARLLVKTGVTMELKKGTYGRIAPRSGHAYHHGIDVLAGVIDSDYRGGIGVILYNTGDNDFPVYKGERIAQIIITPILPPELKVVDKLDETDRNEGAYGSTGQ